MKEEEESAIVGSFEHVEARRKSIPTSETAGEEQATLTDQPREGRYTTFRSGFRRGDDPELWWIGKDEGLDEEQRLRREVHSLYKHELIDPQRLIARFHSARTTNATAGDLFAPPREATEDELSRTLGYYRHEEQWVNRFINGDSLEVMNSLVVREGMAGKVQCIYFDPPYGIGFGSNWQLASNNKAVGDKDISGEPATIKAFRDTWQLGIHSYLSYLRDRVALAKELLNDRGSLFVQISDENVHLVRCLLDEVFGSDNCVAQIVYKKTSGFTSNDLPSVADYILWFAKDKENMKYNQLYIKKDFTSDSGHFNNIELSSGNRMSIRQWESINKTTISIDNLPKGARVYRIDNLVSTKTTKKEVLEYEFDGQIYTPGSGHNWKAGYESGGMDRLRDARRLYPMKSTLGYVRYWDDFPYFDLNNVWDDILGIQSRDPVWSKQYAVQTSDVTLRRCILMTTDPGDLVLDPTCGSGTTAVVAEQYGRRWIAIDTSRVALSVARQRMLTATFPYYRLSDEGGGVRLGFRYKTAPHITLKSVANGLPPETETLYDQPEEEPDRVRVAGPFSTDTLQNYVALRPDELVDTGTAAQTHDFIEMVFCYLRSGGISDGRSAHRVRFDRLEQVSDLPGIHAVGYVSGEADGEPVLFTIGPRFAPLGRSVANEAIRTMRGPGHLRSSQLFLLGFGFDDDVMDQLNYGRESQDEATSLNMGNYRLTFVRMHDDLLQAGLKKPGKDQYANSFVVVGEPDIAVVDDGEGRCHIEILGLDTFSPLQPKAQAHEAHDRRTGLSDIAYWELDDSYDGFLFRATEIHFGGRNLFQGAHEAIAKIQKASEQARAKNAKRKKLTAREEVLQALRVDIDEEAYERLVGFASESMPREAGRRVAVRVMALDGTEASRVITL